jgi:hypothetical protein
MTLEESSLIIEQKLVETVIRGTVEILAESGGCQTSRSEVDIVIIVAIDESGVRGSIAEVCAISAINGVLFVREANLSVVEKLCSDKDGERLIVNVLFRDATIDDPYFVRSEAFTGRVNASFS